MGVDFQSLRDSDPSTLSTVAGQWSDAKSKLADASAAASGVNSKMGQGAWTGDAAANAQVSIERAGTNVSAAVTEAGVIKDTISDAQELFVEAKDKLDDAIAEVDADPNLKIDDNGDISVNMGDKVADMSLVAAENAIAAANAKADDLEVKVEEAVAQAQLVDIKASDALWAAANYDEDTAATTFNADAGDHRMNVEGINNLISDMEDTADEMPSNYVPGSPKPLTDREYEIWQNASLVDKGSLASATADSTLNAEMQGAISGEGDHNNHIDARRHAYWNLRMARDVDPETAEAFATGHEHVPASPAGGDANPPGETLMDLHNNEVGRDIYSDNPDDFPYQHKNELDQRLANGDLIVIDDDGNLVRSS